MQGFMTGILGRDRIPTTQSLRRRRAPMLFAKLGARARRPVLHSFSEGGSLRRRPRERHALPIVCALSGRLEVSFDG
jgi:hypothetical protein